MKKNRIKHVKGITLMGLNLKLLEITYEISAGNKQIKTYLSL